MFEPFRGRVRPCCRCGERRGETGMNENEQRLKGIGERIEGKAREIGGAITGNTGEEVKGKAEQIKGKARGKIADVSDALEED